MNLVNLSVNTFPGRNRRLDFEHLTVLDETYNSSPEAVNAALSMLVSLPGRHFAVLGTMLELGEQSFDLHLEMAKRLVQLRLDGLVFVSNGQEANAIAMSSEEFPHFAIVATPEEAVIPLSSWLLPGDVVLLKASREIRLERLIPLLVKHTSNNLRF